VAPDFVLDLLAELRAGRYRPRALARFFRRSWRRSRETARAHPRLVRSWAKIAAGLALGEAAALALEARLGSAEAARRAAPGVALCLAAQQLDAYAHLGMNARARGGPLFDRLGVSMSLTLARQAIAGLVWGHLLGGRPVPRTYALAALVAASATDVADGALARLLGRATYLGWYLDGAADLSFWAALTLTLGARRMAPRWLVVVLLGRWAVSFGLGCASYFGWMRRPPLGHSRAGRTAGAAQAAALGVALLPMSAAGREASWRRLVYLAAGALAVAASLGQVRGVLRTPSGAP
jgi:phosphatidylglycerophosphate synthase